MKAVLGWPSSWATSGLAPLRRYSLLPVAWKLWQRFEFRCRRHRDRAQAAPGAVRCRSAPPAVRRRSCGKLAGPQVEQRPFNMNDKVLYQSYSTEPAISVESYNAGSHPNIQ